MPVYVYRVVRSSEGDPTTPETTFEVRQSIHDAPLTHHPDTGERVERVICAPNIASGKLGDAAIANAGFTKYQRMSDGTYQRQAGSAGPKHVDPQKFKGALGE